MTTTAVVDHRVDLSAGPESAAGASTRRPHHHELSAVTDRRVGQAIAAVATAGMVTSVAFAVVSALGILR